jgi:arylsulfatase A-like enzyme
MTLNPTTSRQRILLLSSAPRTPTIPSLLGSLDILVVAAWCGLTAGLLEVGTRVLCRAINPVHRLYSMTRHFVWLTPLANMLLFVVVGLCLAAMTRMWPRIGGKLGLRLICALAILPMLMVAVPQIFAEAWFILALGIASWLVPPIERRAAYVRRLLAQTFPGLLGIVFILVAAVYGGDWLKERREANRAQPPAGSPNVLLIVLDTVRADRLSLYGYERPTTPTLERLAKEGIRFDAARATAPWTLMSHASFFTGRWPHELDVEWVTPLRNNFPMLSEYLGAHGYATAGLVSNTYCAYDTGLSVGFTHYEDYIVEKLSALRTSVIIDETVKTILIAGLRHETGPLRAAHDWLTSLSEVGTRRNAESINRGLLSWLDGRPNPGRPFFVFLNYLDAHAPYKVPSDTTRRFGRKPQTRDEIRVLYEQWTALDKLDLPRHYLTLARDCYDSCLAYLDEQIRLLLDDLERRGVLSRTLVVITSDHGEGLGEHDLFEHGESLYSTEIHVPLLIIPPAGVKTMGVVRETVSLRDLPATITEMVGLGSGSPFPGRSLSALWSHPAAQSAEVVDAEALSELPSPSPSDSSHGRSPARRGPLVSLAKGAHVYIRNEADRTEELYDQREDPRELTNRVGNHGMMPILEQFRKRLARIKKQERIGNTGYGLRR